MYVTICIVLYISYYMYCTICIVIICSIYNIYNIYERLILTERNNMIELLEKRKAELKAKYKKTPDIEIYIRISELNILIKRYKKQIEAEVDAAGFREELGNLVTLMAGLEAV